MLGFKRFILLLISSSFCFSWGFHAHRTIHEKAIYALPEAMAPFFLEHADYIIEASVNADQRRYVDSSEAPRHYIDLDCYGDSPLDSIPKYWSQAKAKFGEDTLQKYGILPWVINWEYQALVRAMDSGNTQLILKHITDLGHYVADACVPLHSTMNYDGQLTGQDGIHALWETSIPEAFSSDYDYFVGKALYLNDPQQFSWNLIKESFTLKDSVLDLEWELNASFDEENKYHLDLSKTDAKKTFSPAYVSAYNKVLNGMVERRLQVSIKAIASFWYSAWVDAGEPDLMGAQDREQLLKKN